MRVTWNTLLLATLCIGWSAAGLRAQIELGPERIHPCRATIAADVDRIELGRAFTVGIQFEVEDGWHIYWHSPRDGADPTRVTWEVPEGFTVGALQWPPPRRVDEEGYISYVYEKKSWLLATIQPPSRWEGDRVAIRARAEWTVCREICLEGQASLSLELPISSEPRQVSRVAPEIRRVGQQIPRPLHLDGDWNIHHHWQSQGPEKGRWRVQIRHARLEIGGQTVQVFPYDLEYARVGEPAVKRNGRNLELEFPVDIKDRAFRPQRLRALLQFRRDRNAGAEMRSVSTGSFEIRYRKTP